MALLRAAVMPRDRCFKVSSMGGHLGGQLCCFEVTITAADDACPIKWAASFSTKRPERAEGKDDAFGSFFAQADIAPSSAEGRCVP